MDDIVHAKQPITMVYILINKSINRKYLKGNNFSQGNWKKVGIGKEAMKVLTFIGSFFLIIKHGRLILAKI